MARHAGWKPCAGPFPSPTPAVTFLNTYQINKTRVASMLLSAFASQHALAVDTCVGDPGTLGAPAS